MPLKSNSNWIKEAEDELGDVRQLPTLLHVMERLRDPETGCPWDVEQTFSTIAPYTIEEAYEVADAIERDDEDDLCDELGDLLLQVVFHAQIAKEKGSFSFEDVVAAVNRKMIRRHPHVFGDVDRNDPEAVKVNWEAIKAEERSEKRARKARATGQSPDEELGNTSRTLDGVTATLPPLQRAVKLQAKAARVGFDWPDAKSIMDKLREETEEVDAELSAPTLSKEKLTDEIGDVLFVVANLARKTGIDPGTALEGTNRKFIRRFNAVEDELRKTSTPVGTADLQTMETAWQRAKQNT